jgi:hypothetical protein
MDILGTIRSWFSRPVSAAHAPAPGDAQNLSALSARSNDRRKDGLLARQYGAYAGVYAAALKPDNDIDPYGLDSMAVEVISTCVDTIVSMTVSKGLTITADGEAQQAFLDAAWKRNKIDRLLQFSALHGEVGGDVYVMIDRDDDARVGTVRVLDPRVVDVRYDLDTLEPHTYFVHSDTDDPKVLKRKVIAKMDGGASWLVADQISFDDGRNWQTNEQVVWPFAWAPIQHCQGNPDPSNFHGQGIRLSILKNADDINFEYSLVRRTTRLNTHPTWVASGLGPPPHNAAQKDVGSKLAWTPGKILRLPPAANGVQPDIKAITPSTNVMDAMAFSDKIAQKIYGVYGLPDPDQMMRLGNITGTALKVAYSRAVARVRAKQQLLGDLIERVSSALLELAGFGPSEVVVTWPDPTPQNDQERVQTATMLVSAGIMSKATAAEEFGLDWEQESARIAEERADSTNIGADLLAAFDTGAGAA